MLDGFEARMVDVVVEEGDGWKEARNDACLPDCVVVPDAVDVGDDVGEGFEAFVPVDDVQTDATAFAEAREDARVRVDEVDGAVSLKVGVDGVGVEDEVRDPARRAAGTRSSGVRGAANDDVRGRSVAVGRGRVAAFLLHDRRKGKRASVGECDVGRGIILECSRSRN